MACTLAATYETNQRTFSDRPRREGSWAVLQGCSPAKGKGRKEREKGNDKRKKKTESGRRGIEENGHEDEENGA